MSRTNPSIGNIYLVGGAVRDELLGIPVRERDWVVVGGSAAGMLAAGFRQADPEFPVFLHPETAEEYALARRESKHGAGYRGFAIDASADVTLEEDLARRDLTVNAMARDAEGHLIDPFNGQEDLAMGTLRHVTPAFVEDPLRVLRAARFAAKLGTYGFHLAHATHRLMRQMVVDGAIAELQPQRIGKEMDKALGTDQPWRFFEVLQACGGLAALAPGLAQSMRGANSHAKQHKAVPLQALRQACKDGLSIDQRFASLMLQSGDDVQILTARLQLVGSRSNLLLAARHAWQTLGQSAAPEPADILDLLNRLRAWHRNSLFESVVAVLEAQAERSSSVRRLRAAYHAARQISPAALQARGLSGIDLGKALQTERMAAVARAWAVPVE